MAYYHGLDAKIYYEAGGMAASPTWTEYDDVEDVSISVEHDEAEVKNRASGWVKYLLGPSNATIEITATADPADAGYQAFRDAWANKTIIGVAAMSGDVATSGSEGPQIDCYVTSMKRSDPQSGAGTVTFTCKPSAIVGTGAVAPSWATVT